MSVTVDKDRDNVLVKCVSSILKETVISELKSEQFQVLSAIFVNRCDVLCILQTGFGKSLPHQISPLILRKMANDEHFKQYSGMHLIIVAPLKSLMRDQVSRMEKLGVSAGFIGQSEDIDKKIANGELEVVLGSPESLVGNNRWRDVLLDKYRGKVLCIVVDEVHTVAKWGEKQGGQSNPFRVWFRHVSELRSVLPDVPILCLTATASLQTQKIIKKSLELAHDVMVIQKDPDRSNIKYMVMRCSPNVGKNLFWLVDLINDNKMNIDTIPRMISYCSSILKCGNIHDFLLKELSEELKKKNFLAQFHSKTEEPVKEDILESVSESDSPLRVIIATSALGTGVVMKGTFLALHYGPPDDVDCFVQETGRIGREGQPSLSLLMFNGSMLKTCGDSMKDYANNNTECRRIFIAKNFNNQNMEFNVIKHSCCDICAHSCDCDSCDSSLLPIEHRLHIFNELSGSDTDQSSSTSSLSSTE